MNRRLFLIPLLPVVAHCALLKAGDVDKTPYHFAPKLEADLGFSRAVRVRDTLYISGSVGAGDMPNAIKQAYDRIAKTLESHGLTFQNVVKDTVFTTDLDAFLANREARKVYYRNDYPASTWIQVGRLNTPDLIVEVEAIAAFPDPTRGAQAKAPHDTVNDSAFAELQSLREQLMSATRNGDRAVLNRLLADDFLFVHSTGVVETKAQYIERAAANARSDLHLELRFLEEKVRVYDERVAVVVTESVRDHATHGASLRFRGTDVLLKRGSEWQWISVHSTRLPEP
jgi:2-iminobutanoate/2-iminopropanoate deaminase